MQNSAPETAFDIDIVESRGGFIRCRIKGKNAKKHLKNEPGVHRWQRVPPTEKRGRVHTSTITVAILPEEEEIKVSIDERDIEWKAFRGSGPGGQHRNKTDSAVLLHHIPTGIKIRSESERSQKQNKDTAIALLTERIYTEKKDAYDKNRSNIKKGQVGDGMRGDKKRTVRLQDDIVIDHESGRKISAKKYLKGELEELF